MLDLAAGTGKLTRLLAPLAGEVVAVEPVAEMRARLVGGLPDVRALDGTAQAIPLPDAGVDAVFVAEAFHWFAEEEAVAEIARVLRPGGGLAVLWNNATWSAEELPWLAEVGEVLEPARAAAVPGEWARGSDRWREVIEGSGSFEPLEHLEAAHELSLTASDLVLQISSWSFVGALPPEAREPLLERVAAVLDAHGVEQVAVPYRTDAYWTRRR